MKRSDAKALGLVRYRTGKPCPKGHVGDRFVSTGQCNECLIESTKQWRADNPDKVKAYTKEYRKGREEILREKSKNWSRENRQLHKEMTNDWHKRNPEARRIHRAHVKARRRNSYGRFTIEELRAQMEKQEYLCVYCQINIRDEYNIDHIQPLSRGGENTIGNIQLLCPPCNQHKHTKNHAEYMQRLNKGERNESDRTI